jgi:Ca2+-transporting ATPase
VLFLCALGPLAFGPDEPKIDQASASMTMAYMVLGLGTVLSGLVMRRDPTSGLVPPVLRAVLILLAPTALLVLSTELDFLQRGLLTQALTGGQWLVCLGLALVLPIVVEADKWLRRRRTPAPAATDAVRAVNPQRAVATA